MNNKVRLYLYCIPYEVLFDPWWQGRKCCYIVSLTEQPHKTWDLIMGHCEQSTYSTISSIRTGVDPDILVHLPAGDVVTPGFFEEYLNAENVLLRPYGAGEMIAFNFAYNILTLKFMKSSQQLGDDTLRKTLATANVGECIGTSKGCWKLGAWVAKALGARLWIFMLHVVKTVSWRQYCGVFFGGWVGGGWHAMKTKGWGLWVFYDV